MGCRPACFWALVTTAVFLASNIVFVMQSLPSRYEPHPVFPHPVLCMEVAAIVCCALEVGLRILAAQSYKGWLVDLWLALAALSTVPFLVWLVRRQHMQCCRHGIRVDALVQHLQRQRLQHVQTAVQAAHDSSPSVGDWQRSVWMDHRQDLLYWTSADDHPWHTR